VLFRSVGDDKVEHGYGNLQREGLVAFGLETQKGNLTVTFELDDSKILFYRMRVVGVGRAVPVRVYFAGWRRRNEDGAVTVSYYTVNPEGKVEHWDGWDNNSGRREPVWFSEEQV
jgi:hypothetical protein